MGLAALTPAAANEATVKKAANTKVQIGGYGSNGPGNGGEFQVEVISKKLKCKKGRKVTMYREQPGGAAKIGSAKAISGEGTWVAIIDDKRDPTADAYYAVAPAEPGCKKDRSEDFFFSGSRELRDALTRWA